MTWNLQLSSAGTELTGIVGVTSTVAGGPTTSWTVGGGGGNGGVTTGEKPGRRTKGPLGRPTFPTEWGGITIAEGRVFERRFDEEASAMGARPNDLVDFADLTGETVGREAGVEEDTAK